MCESVQSSLILGPRNFYILRIQATIQVAGFLQVPPKSPFKKLLLDTGLGHYTYVRMSTNLKSPDMLKDTECEKGQLFQLLPIP
jgi:hypothetical protein